MVRSSIYWLIYLHDGANHIMGPSLLCFMLAERIGPSAAEFLVLGGSLHICPAQVWVTEKSKVLGLGLGEAREDSKTK